MDCSTPGLPVHHQLLQLAQTHVHQVGEPSNHLILCHPLLLLLSMFSSIRVFANESVLRIRWPKCWCFSFSISPCSEYSGLISFRVDWLDLLAVQGTLQESSLTRQLKSINSSVLNFLYSPTSFIAQLSYPYMTPRKTIALTAAAAAKSLQSCPTLCNPIDSNSPGTPSLGFSRQEHWSGLPFPSPMHESEKWKWSCSVVSDS